MLFSFVRVPAKYQLGDATYVKWLGTPPACFYGLLTNGRLLKASI